ncbi:MAG: DMT family transporter [Deltaproteobacteria bacterium]|nr:DMT family transporter [Deltaproteobacteria bacterium]
MSALTLAWLVPALLALFSYGVGQGLVKKWAAEVPPARYCIYFVIAKAAVNLGYFFTQAHPPLITPGNHAFLELGLASYVLDGIGWIFYFEAIVSGPIAIIGTLSAAYPALVVLLARVFLGETLAVSQNVGVVAVILGCIGLSYAPPDPSAQIKGRKWILFSFLTIVAWGIDQTMVKHAYSLPEANDVNLAVLNTIGEALALGTYGFLRGRREGGHSLKEWLHSFVPMAMLAGGDLGVLVASRFGPISIVSPLTGAYPAVTLIFATLVLKEVMTRLQWLCIGFVMLGIVLSPTSLEEMLKAVGMGH